MNIWEKTFHAMIIMLVFLLGCNKKNGPNEPNIPIIDISAQTALHDKIGRDATLRYDELRTTMDIEMSLKTLATEMKSRDDVTDAGVSIDGTTVWWNVNSGFTHLFMMTENFVEFMPKPHAKAVVTNNLVNNLPHNTSALLLSPFWHQLVQHSLPDHLSSIQQSLSTNNYSPTYKRQLSLNSQELGISDYLNWDNFGVIGVFTHAGMSRTQEIGINTGVLKANLPSQYNQDITDGNLLLSTISGYTETFVAAMPGWFRKYNGNLTQTLIYISGCAARANSTLSNPLTSTESAFFGWTASVGPNQANTTGTDLFSQLLDSRLNCTDALAIVTSHGNAQSGPASFGFNGNGNLRLLPPWEVVATNPSDGASNVPPTTIVAAAVSTDLNPTTVNTSTVTLSGTSGTAFYNDRTIAFEPTTSLQWDRTYTVTISGRVEDQMGNPLGEDYTWSFKTIDEPTVSCVNVRIGGWEFCLYDGQNNCILQFENGDLVQNGCFVSYDDDNFFAGQLDGTFWSGENVNEMFKFSGHFSGTNYDRFDGTLTLTDGSGLTVVMKGQYGMLLGKHALTMGPVGARQLGERLHVLR